MSSNGWDILRECELKDVTIDVASAAPPLRTPVSIRFDPNEEKWRATPIEPGIDLARLHSLARVVGPTHDGQSVAISLGEASIPTHAVMGVVWLLEKKWASDRDFVTVAVMGSEGVAAAAVTELESKGYKVRVRRMEVTF